MRRAWILVTILALIAFCLAAVSSTELAAAAPLQLQEKPLLQKNPIPMSEDSVKAGRSVYARICRACHGLQGKGDGVAAPPGAKPANLVDAEWKHGGSDAEIFNTIKQGIAPYEVMQPWGNKLSDNEIWSVVNYLRDLATRAKR